MFKKTYYGAHIAPACAYCLHGSTAADPKMILASARALCRPTTAAANSAMTR